MSTAAQAPTPDDDDAIADVLADAWLRKAASDPTTKQRLIERINHGPADEDWEPELDIQSIAATARAAGVSEGTVCNMTQIFKSRLAIKFLNDPSIPKNLRTLARNVLTKL